MHELEQAAVKGLTAIEVGPVKVELAGA